MRTKKTWLALCGVLVLTGHAKSEESAVSDGTFWNAAATLYGDGRDEKPASPTNLPQGFRNDYVIETPKAGWYELILHGAGPGFRHDVFIDGVNQWRFAATDAEDRAGNLWLEAGRHVLRIQRLGRVGFPKRIFDRFELRPAAGRSEVAVSARKTTVDVVRAGEPLEIDLTAGGTPESAVFTLWRTDLQNRSVLPAQVGSETFQPSDKPLTRRVKIDCPTEGVFSLSARVNDQPLSAAQFQIGSYAVVDVKQVAPASGKTELVYDIDCVKQTLNGRPIAADTFVECNGPTRVHRSSAGEYRKAATACRQARPCRRPPSRSRCRTPAFPTASTCRRCRSRMSLILSSRTTPAAA